MDANQYPPEYLAEDSSRQLINVAIAFALLETIFLTFFTFARRINSTTNGLDFWLIPAAYLACFSHVIIISRGLTSVFQMYHY